LCIKGLMIFHLRKLPFVIFHVPRAFERHARSGRQTYEVACTTLPTKYVRT